MGSGPAEVREAHEKFVRVRPPHLLIVSGDTTSPKVFRDGMRECRAWVGLLQATVEKQAHPLLRPDDPRVD